MQIFCVKKKARSLTAILILITSTRHCSSKVTPPETVNRNDRQMRVISVILSPCDIQLTPKRVINVYRYIIFIDYPAYLYFFYRGNHNTNTWSNSNKRGLALGWRYNKKKKKYWR
ncbi:hypothetical protein J3Q64DRAFT_1760562 [Phycomyces blakesleeanus]|uniref:Secreted protein n=1 Tax=Phycomyces blakesleeanus TaxID=4837 RepID=A0ABR3AQW3_PHYBL